MGARKNYALQKQLMKSCNDPSPLRQSLVKMYEDQYTGLERRRLAGCELSNDVDAPHGMFLLVPLLMILMLVFFLYRKPIRNRFTTSQKPFFQRVRGIVKKSPCP